MKCCKDTENLHICGLFDTCYSLQYCFSLFLYLYFVFVLVCMHTAVESKANVLDEVLSILSAQVQLDAFQFFFIHPGLGNGHTDFGLYTLQICPAKL